MTLPLYGVAQYARGFETARPRHVLRMRTPANGHSAASDIALVRSGHDVDVAVARGFTGVVSIGDVGATEVSDSNIDRVIALPAKFDYLDDGDVIGFQPEARRFRTLYR